MEKTVKLDPRKARKLTDRGCANVLGGWVGAMASSSLYSPEVVKQALLDVGSSDAFWEAIRFQAERPVTVVQQAMLRAVGENATGSQTFDAEDMDPQARALWRSLGGVLSGLRVIASERSVRRAVAWWLEQDDKWETLLQEAGE